MRFLETQFEYIHTDMAWRRRDRPWFCPTTDSLTLAHDALEHFPDDKGTAEDELQALGAMYLVRCDGSSVVSITRDLIDLYWKYGHREPLKPMRTWLKQDEIAENIRISIDQAFDYDPLRHNTLRGTTWTKKSVYAWIAHGYRRAQGRFRGLDTRRLFEDTAKILEKTTFSAITQYPHSYNKILTLTVDLVKKPNPLENDLDIKVQINAWS